MSLFNLLAGAYLALLHRISGHRQLSIGTPLANRGGRRFRKTAGLFMQVCPLRVEISADETFRTLVGKVRRELGQVIRNQHYVMANPPQRRHYDVTFNLQHFAAPDFGGHPARPEWISESFQTKWVLYPQGYRFGSASAKDRPPANKCSYHASCQAFLDSAVGRRFGLRARTISSPKKR